VRAILDKHLLRTQILVYRTCAVANTNLSNLDAIRRNAELYVASSNLILRIWSLIAVSNRAPGNSKYRKVPISEWHGRPVLSYVANCLVSVSNAIRLMIRSVRHWLTNPFGIYSLFSSIWFVYTREVSLLLRDPLRGPLCPEAVSITVVLGVLTVKFAIVSVGLNHGLSPRLLHRNAYLRESAVTAEQTLAEMACICQRVLRALDEVVDELCRTMLSQTQQMILLGDIRMASFPTRYLSALQ